jgi:hypothetical protein
MHGGVWDTILAAQALAQAGESNAPLVLTAENLYETQTPEGGFPYGRDFEDYPDVDDTSRALMFLEKMAPFTLRTGAVESRRRGFQWLLQRQNSDGGWGAFDQDNVGSRMMKRFTYRLPPGYQERVGFLAGWLRGRDWASRHFIHGISGVSQSFSGDGPGKISQSVLTQ